MKNKKLLVHLHLFYHNQLDYMISKLKNIDGCEWDLFVTVCEKTPEVENKLRELKSDVKILSVNNIGYDVWPFIQVLRAVELKDYDYILKLHTKNCRGKIFPNYEFRNRLIEPLLENKSKFIENIQVLENYEDVGMVCSKYCLYNYSGDVPEEGWMLNVMMKRLGLHYAGGQYLSGTMFLSRANIFEPIVRSDISENDFSSQSSTGGASSNAHVLERVFSLIVLGNGLRIYPVGTFRLRIKSFLHKMCSVEIVRSCYVNQVVINFLKKKCVLKLGVRKNSIDGTKSLKCEFSVGDKLFGRTAVFAAYCPDGRISDAQIYYLNGLKKVVDNIIFVADSEVFPEELEKIKSIVCYCDFTRHYGYDFLSYKRGFEYFIKSRLCEMTDELIFCNDSCYAPIYPFEEMFNKMSAKSCDFWGVTANENPSKHQSRHLQSFFLVFKSQVFRSVAFAKFMKSVKRQRKIKDVINKYEIPMSKYFLEKGFSFETYISENLVGENFVNKTFYPLTTIKQGRLPLVKVKVFNNKFLSSIKEDSFATLDYISLVNKKLAEIIREANKM